MHSSWRSIQTHNGRDLRTLVQSIIELADELTSELSGDQRRAAAAIRRYGRHATDVLDALSYAVAITEKTASLNPVPVDFAARCAQALDTISDRSEDAESSFDLDLPSDGVQIEADANAVDLILRCLFADVAASREDGPATLALDGTDTTVTLRITRTHDGTPTEPSPQEGESPPSNPTTLIAAAQELTGLLNGILDVQTHDGNDTWTLRLPRTPAAPPVSESPAAAPTDSEDAEPVRLSLLAVEDNPVSLKLLRRMLEEEYRIETATGVDEALRKATNQNFDAFILDVNLSERRTGIEVLHDLR